MFGPRESKEPAPDPEAVYFIRALLPHWLLFSVKKIFDAIVSQLLILFIVLRSI